MTNKELGAPETTGYRTLCDALIQFLPIKLGDQATAARDHMILIDGVEDLLTLSSADHELVLPEHIQVV